MGAYSDVTRFDRRHLRSSAVALVSVESIAGEEVSFAAVRTDDRCANTVHSSNVEEEVLAPYHLLGAQWAVKLLK